MSDPRGGQPQHLTDECFFNIRSAHQKVCVCVRASRQGGSSLGGVGGGRVSAGESVTQSGCDYCQPPENGVREQEHGDEEEAGKKS